MCRPKPGGFLLLFHRRCAAMKNFDAPEVSKSQRLGPAAPQLGGAFSFGTIFIVRRMSNAAWSDGRT
jgi:hypothetical protein